MMELATNTTIADTTMGRISDVSGTIDTSTFHFPLSTSTEPVLDDGRIERLPADIKIQLTLRNRHGDFVAPLQHSRDVFNKARAELVHRNLRRAMYLFSVQPFEHLCDVA